MDSMKTLEAKRQFSAVAQMVAFRSSKVENAIIFQGELTGTLSAISYLF
jgi:hypothetical protein